MSMPRKNLLAILAIVLAVVVPIGVALQAQNEISSNPVVKIKMTGYDPRDLLYGHYLMFSYDWNWDEKKNGENEEICSVNNCCLCVEGKEVNPKVYLKECKAAKTDATCAHVLTGKSWGFKNFEGPSTRFFVDEEKALPLENFFRKELGKTDFHMGLSLPPSGKARIEKLYIDGKPYLQYMEENPDKFVIKPDPALEPIPADSSLVEPVAP